MLILNCVGFFIFFILTLVLDFNKTSKTLIFCEYLVPSLTFNH